MNCSLFEFYCLRGIFLVSPLQFPYQGKPNKTDFELWKDCVYKCFCVICPHPTEKGQIIVGSMMSPPQILNNNFADQLDYSDIVSAIVTQPDLIDKFNNLPPRFRDIIGDLTHSMMHVELMGTPSLQNKY
jgi:hypothetical protein